MAKAKKVLKCKQCKERPRAAGNVDNWCTSCTQENEEIVARFHRDEAKRRLKLGIPLEERK